MENQLSIGVAAKLTGLSVKAIRFYEDLGLVPAANRTESGYRHFTRADVRRLQLVKLLRTLGMPLVEIKPLVAMAFDTDCAQFASELAEVFSRQRGEISQRISELEVLRTELDRLARHVEHCECEPGRSVVDCDYCSILDKKGGEENDRDS